jgi:N-hydroxyarylamine O-acetyltransferase
VTSGAATGSAAEWEVERLDLDAYLARVGLEGRPVTTPRGLRLLHRAHATAIPFENLDILLGRPIRLDLDALQEKLVRRRRGGYCYEQNLLFGAALERLGFGVTRLAARVHLGAARVAPRTHMTLRVEASGTDWLADVGFGGEGLLDPLPLADGAVTAQAGWNHALDRDPERGWVLRSLHPDGWFDLYSFTTEPQHRVDYEVANHYVSTHPRSPFVTQLVVQRSTPDLRLALCGLRLVEARPDGTESATDLPIDALAPTLTERLGIALDAGELTDLVAQADRVSSQSGFSRTSS